jgi:hypothetical protein
VTPADGAGAAVWADAGDPRVDADLASEDDLTRGEPKV